jgi:uncharacterized protein YfaQ (DUF2300 family)
MRCFYEYPPQENKRSRRKSFAQEKIKQKEKMKSILGSSLKQKQPSLSDKKRSSGGLNTSRIRCAHKNCF